MGSTSKKKRVAIRNSPFRIKVGCLVALRYRPRGNNITFITPDGKVLTGGSSGIGSREQNDGDDAGDGDILYSDPIQSVQFSEVWTDPHVGRDEGLALIGSRIRCVFPKSVLLEPFHAKDRTLEGDVVNVVNCSDQFVQQRETWKKHRISVGTLVDLLIDNMGDKQMTAMPFLHRIDHVPDDAWLQSMTDVERRSYRNEQRIRGGAHKAIVRVLLSDEQSSGMVLLKNSDKKKNNNREQQQKDGEDLEGDDNKYNRRIEARWAIRKRVPVKIVSMMSEKGTSSSNVVKATTEEEKSPGMDTPPSGVDQYLTPTKSPTIIDTSEGKRTMDALHSNGSNGNGNDNNGKKKSNKNGNNKDDMGSNLNLYNDNTVGDQSERIRTSTQSPRKKRKITSDKDFSLPRYLGDGSDPPAQQEGNWRWQAGRYNPFSVLADRPVSQALVQALGYNFVGEVISIQPEMSSTPQSTLATVTLRRLVLPEHTLTGRMATHGPCDVFEDADLSLRSLLPMKLDTTNTTKAERDDGLLSQNDDQIESSLLFRVPIEELVIVSRKVQRGQVAGHGEVPLRPSEMIVQKAYSVHYDTYTDLSGNDEKAKSESSDIPQGIDDRGFRHCRRCRQISMETKRLTGVSHVLCHSCCKIMKTMALYWGGNKIKSKQFKCDCDYCLKKGETDRLLELSKEVNTSVTKLGLTLQELKDYATNDHSGFISTRFVTKGMGPINFTMFPMMDSFTLASASKPIAKVKPKKTAKKSKKSPLGRNLKMSGAPKTTTKRNGRSSPLALSKSSFVPIAVQQSTERDVFRPTSSRLLPYDVSNRKFDVSVEDLYQWKMFRSSYTYPEKPRNLRILQVKESADDGDINAAGKKKLLGRAARATQRRLVRGVAAMGVSVDTLAGREQQLRFDRSAIHDWGVFVDIDVREGEMIIEYRGEVIGNAMAEKREIEYFAAKLGSDYMFRMDDLTVCDATKQGNVARFINASCDPNCYTKIISIDGVKRIVVYAKRSIQSGEELCYDYKFALEPDPAQRIPCRCRARDCRGYLNWDNRYEDSPKSSEKDTNDCKRARIKGSKVHS
jgi:hypothetical protein